uniref:aldehyde dehydrogenase family protein n=1 Tax=Priestia megaterium TaxID=1404 RepID=UPI0012B9E323
FVEGRVFSRVRSNMKIVEDEMFGGVVVIERFKDEKEGIKVGNDREYGLGGRVFRSEGGKGVGVIKKVGGGMSWAKRYHFRFKEGCWGGYKE